MNKQKHERLNTPVGEARWAHVQKPKPSLDGTPKYQIDVVFAPTDTQWHVFGKDIGARVKASGGKHNPIRWETQKDDTGKDVKTGNLVVTFKTGAQFKPSLFDKYGRALADGTLIGNGSKVRVNFSPVAYEGFGGGITLYLNAVQVLDLVPYAPKTADSYGFAVEDPPPVEDVMSGEPPPEDEEEVIEPPPDVPPAATHGMSEAADDLPF